VIPLILLLVVMNLIWSGSYVAVKLGLESMPPLVLVFWRMGISAAILIFWIALRRVQVRLDRKVLFRIVALGIVIAGSHILWVTGLKYTNASDASLLYAFEPIWAVLMASVFLKEKFRPAMGVGLAVAFAGLIILSDIRWSTFSTLFAASVAFGNMLIVLGLFCESMFSIVAKPIAERSSAMVVIAGALLVTELILVGPITLTTGFVLPATSQDVFVLLYLSIPCTVIGYVLWIRLMRHLPVNVMCYTIFVQPVVGPLIATVVLGEILGRRVLHGGAFLLAGVSIAVVSHICAHRTVIAIPSLSRGKQSHEILGIASSSFDFSQDSSQ
jgi:drug/metabolite transporter (DMT)-like permease